MGTGNDFPELTIRAFILGLMLVIVMAAANTYLGLYAGMTVSASIPAAVISMSIMRGILKKGSILENNIVQTMASAGESVAGARRARTLRREQTGWQLSRRMHRPRQDGRRGVVGMAHRQASQSE